MSVLELDQVSRAFGGIQAVDGVSLTVAPGEIVGIIGPNGSGKSTLFNLITGVYRPDTGRILFQSQDITGWRPYRIARLGVGRTFQIPTLFQHLTAYENLLAAAVEGDWRGAPRRADEVLHLLTLDHVRDERADNLSGGQQKLLELGRVLMRDPRLILLDEVTAGVHPNIRRIILDAIVRLRDKGVSFLIIEHDMEMVRNVCDRIIVMDSGRVVTSGAFEDIVRDSQVMQTYLGRPQ